jgi:ABC-type glycerol-3-phosphate transport system substrate-binding protein
MVFYGEAIGPQGMYNAGESKGMSNIASPVGGIMNYNQSKSEPALKAFVAQLTSQGWESVTEKGPAWYSYRFRRPVKG